MLWCQEWSPGSGHLQTEDVLEGGTQIHKLGGVNPLFGGYPETHFHFPVRMKLGLESVVEAWVRATPPRSGP